MKKTKKGTSVQKEHWKGNLKGTFSCFFFDWGIQEGTFAAFFSNMGCVCDVINVDIQGKFTDAQNELILTWMNSEYTAL